METIELEGFDPEGEPQLRIENGTLHIVFNFMPPSWAENDPDRFRCHGRMGGQGILKDRQAETGHG